MGKIKKLERELELLKEIYNLYYEIDQIQKKNLERFYPIYPIYPTYPTNPWQPIRWTTHTNTTNIDSQGILQYTTGTALLSSDSKSSRHNSLKETWNRAKGCTNG